MFRGLRFRVDVSWFRVRVDDLGFRVDVLSLDKLTICFFLSKLMKRL